VMDIQPDSKLQVHVCGAQYRDCVILKRSTYQGRSGFVFWDYVYDPIPRKDVTTGIQPGIGGTAPAHYFRERSGAQ
jgi:hypothetical protein